MGVKRYLNPPVRGSSHLKTIVYVSYSFWHAETALCASGGCSPYLSLSATKMTRRSSSKEAKMRMICRTLRHLKRHSKSTCSRRESMGLRSSMTCTHPKNCSQQRWQGWQGRVPPVPALPLLACSGHTEWNEPQPLVQTEAAGTALQKNGVLHNSCHAILPRIQLCALSAIISKGSIILPSKHSVRDVKLGWVESMKQVTIKHWNWKLSGLKQP